MWRYPIQRRIWLAMGATCCRFSAASGFENRLVCKPAPSACSTLDSPDGSGACAPRIRTVGLGLRQMTLYTSAHEAQCPIPSADEKRGADPDADGVHHTSCAVTGASWDPRHTGR